MIIEASRGIIEKAKIFHSGNDYLDNYLKSDKVLDNRIGKTFIFLTDKEQDVIGYYTISAGSLEGIDENSRYKLGGAVHIICFAIDEKYQDFIIDQDGKGENIHLSDIMLKDCINRAINLKEKSLGLMFITLCSTKEGEWFYHRNEFEYLDEDMDFSKEDEELDCKKMYLALDME